MSNPFGNTVKFAEDIAERLVGQIEDILDYIFRKKSPNDEKKNNENNENNDGSDSDNDNEGIGQHFGR
jgi:hypothetical protein